MTRLILAAAPLRGASTSAVERLEVYDFGIYTAEARSKRGFTALGLTIDALYGIRHREATRTIKAELGVRFGYRYHAVGRPRGALSHLRMVLKCPAPGLIGRDPEKFIRRDEWESCVILGADSFHFASLDALSDLVPGIWTFEIWAVQRLMAKESFTVIAPLVC
jgi:uncharacterized protein DUF3859